MPSLIDDRPSLREEPSREGGKEGTASKLTRLVWPLAALGGTAAVPGAVPWAVPGAALPTRDNSLLVDASAPDPSARSASASKGLLMRPGLAVPAVPLAVPPAVELARCVAACARSSNGISSGPRRSAQRGWRGGSS